MQRINHLLIILFCIAVWACNDHQQMLSQLEELEQRNLDDSLMTNDSLALSLCDYFDNHGTSNERMRAHYMLARTYTDRGEAPQALEEFHTGSVDVYYFYRSKSADLFLLSSCFLVSLKEAIN